MKREWIRVTRLHRCSVCSHDSWCLVSPDGTIALCMRVQSTRQKELADGNVGWLHKLDGSVPTPPKPRERTVNGNVARTFEKWKALPSTRLSLFAESLGVTKTSLQSLQCVPTRWDGAWGFPMRRPDGKVVGIRIRAEDGKKWSEPGGHEGLFIPASESRRRLFVCEGPTDTAAALTMAYWAIGRPNCAPRVEELNAIVRIHKVREVVIVSDKDEAGLRGAQKLGESLTCRNVVIVLPTKDLRSFVMEGGNRDDVESIISQMVWRCPTDR